MNTFAKNMDITASKSRKGAFAELQACMWLLSIGYEVFRNVVPTGPADIIAFKDSEVLKIDVKTLRAPNGKFNFQRKNTLKAIGRDVSVLYVLPDGSCRWALEIDPHLGDDPNKNCIVCSKPFSTTKPRRVFCSKLCRCNHHYAMKKASINIQN